MRGQATTSYQFTSVNFSAKGAHGTNDRSADSAPSELMPRIVVVKFWVRCLPSSQPGRDFAAVRAPPFVYHDLIGHHSTTCADGHT